MGLGRFRVGTFCRSTERKGGSLKESHGLSSFTAPGEKYRRHLSTKSLAKGKLINCKINA
jgi:hypothetical protein